MPFSSDWNDMYELGIRPACVAAGVECARVDEQIFSESILDRIYAQMERAEIVIAEMTGRNPNVLYETGYAHGLGKRVIFLTKSADDIPFDLRHYPHVVHAGSVAAIKRELEKRVCFFVERPSDATSTSGRQPDVAKAIALATSALSRIRLVSCRVTPTSLRHGEEISITYEIASGCPSPITVWLGADCWPLYSLTQDIEVVVEPGIQEYQRCFSIGDEWPKGHHELGVGVWVGEKSLPERSLRLAAKIPAASIEVL